MFQISLDEDKICGVLKAFLEEWGSENIVVALPREWPGTVLKTSPVCASNSLQTTK